MLLFWLGLSYDERTKKQICTAHLKRWVVDFDKFQKVAATAVIRSVSQEFAITPESEEARQITLARVTEPLGLNENDDVEDGVDDGEDSP